MVNNDPRKTFMENNMEEQLIKEKELIEINRLPAVYANKHYIMQNGALIKIVMCEKAPDVKEEIQARVAVILAIQDFFAFCDMVNNKRNELEQQLKAMQGAKK